MYLFYILLKPRLTTVSCNCESFIGRDFTFANFDASQCKQTNVCVDKVETRPEDPFPRFHEIRNAKYFYLKEY